MANPLTDIDLLDDDVIIGQQGHERMHDLIHTGLKAVKNLLVTLDSQAVRTSTDQTIAGIKTFSSSPIIPTATLATQAVNKGQMDTALSGKTDTGHVHTIANITSLQTTLDSKANLASPTFTGTVSGITKSMVGLSNVDNTADTAKPVSTDQQTALNLKANLASPTFTGTVSGISKSMVGLSNVDNTSDLSKPISTATQSALDLKATDSGLVHLSGTETITGLKSFSTAPKLKTTSTAGYAWVATGSDGSGDWSAIVNAPGGTVPWANITGRPSTFTPEAHVHAISDVTNLSSTLSGKVDTTRTVSAGTGLTGGGDLSANRTFAVVYGTTASSAAQGNDSRLSDTRVPTDLSVTTAKIADANITLPKLATTAKPYDISFVQSLDTRAVGYGEMLYGIRIPKAIVITSIRFRMGTADASGTTTCQLYSSATAAAANTAIAGTSGTAAIDPTAVTGSLSIAAGTYLYVYTSAIGTTPGKGLIADIEAYLA